MQILGDCDGEKKSDGRSDRDLDDTHFFEKGQSDTNTEELAEMLDREFAECLEDGILYFLGILLSVVWVVWEDHGGEICVVDGVMDRDRELILAVAVDHGASNSTPHRLGDLCEWIDRLRETEQV